MRDSHELPPSCSEATSLFLDAGPPGAAHAPAATTATCRKVRETGRDLAPFPVDEPPRPHFPSAGVVSVAARPGKALRAAPRGAHAQATAPVEAVTSTRAGRGRIKILFLSANAVRDRPLRLDEELRKVERRLRAARFRDAFELVSCPAVRLEDLQQSLLEHAPDVVHFAGHGDADEGLVLFDEEGKQVRLSAEALASLFDALCGQVRLAVFNACFSAEHAAALCESVEAAVGMGDAIDDQAALGFAGAFYEALAYGRSVRTAFECGVAAVKSLCPAQAHLPRLCTQEGVDVDVAFFNPPRGPRPLFAGSPRVFAGAAAAAVTIASTSLVLHLNSAPRAPVSPNDAVAQCRRLIDGPPPPWVDEAKAPGGRQGGPRRDLMAQLSTLHRLADSYRRARKSETYGLAEPLYLCVLDLRERELGGDHFDTAKTLAGLGLLYADQGRDELAERRLLRARGLLERAERPPRELIDVLHALADLYKAKGEIEREQELLLRALEVKAFGPGSFEAREETAGRLEDVAQRYRADGDGAKAEALRERIEASRRAWGPAAMVRIAGGTVPAGALDATTRPADCAAPGADEGCAETTHSGRAREVEVPAFDLDVTKVTNEAFARWLDESASAWQLDAERSVVIRADERPPSPLVYAGGACGGGLAVSGNEPGDEVGQEGLGLVHILAQVGYESRPVVCVTWQGANDYCRAQGKRLPSEVEWGLAAKGGVGRPSGRGAERPRPEGVAFDGAHAAGPHNAVISAHEQTFEGPFDLGGNVAEWTQGGRNAGPKSAQGGGRAGTNFCDRLAPGCAPLPPTFYANDLGFRCARALPKAIKFRLASARSTGKGACPAPRRRTRPRRAGGATWANVAHVARVVRATWARGGAHDGGPGARGALAQGLLIFVDLLPRFSPGATPGRRPTERLYERRTMSHFKRRILLLCALAASLASCAAPSDAPADAPDDAPADAPDDAPGVAESAAPLTNTLVSLRPPDGLILSTGNLYFTSHDASTAAVWRMAQGASPGQEILLYSEPGARFGDIVFAQVNGAFFGYFFSTVGGGVAIKRVPLTGGAAVTLATLTNIDAVNSHRNLVTDGINLYWQDVSSVRKMPIGGGAITVLDPSSPNTPTAGIALQGDNIIYASVSDIRFVPKAGAVTSPALRTIATASSRVTALHAVSNGVYWGEQGGAVRMKVGSTVTTLSTGGAVPTSISNSSASAGGTQAWSQCGGPNCTLFIDTPFPLPNVSLSVGANALGVSVPSSNTVFWGDAAGVHRLTL